MMISGDDVWDLDDRQSDKLFNFSCSKYSNFILKVKIFLLSEDDE